MTVAITVPAVRINIDRNRILAVARQSSTTATTALAIETIRAAGRLLRRRGRSREGSPPSLESGVLLRSIIRRPGRTTAAMRTQEVVATVRYAAVQEFGNRHQKARPFMRPAARIVSRRAPAVMAKRFRATFRNRSLFTRGAGRRLRTGR